jgi:putative membrane protein
LLASRAEEMPMSKRTIRVALAMAGAAALAAAGAGASARGDELAEFAKKAAVGGLAEVELGRVAVRNASDPRVKQFGQHMIDDHSKANGALKAAAGQQGLALPETLDPEHRKDVEKLSGLSGSAFDRAYMDDMVEDHEKDVREFEEAAKEGGDSPVKKFAQDTLPTLREHLRMARDVQSGIKGK